MGSTDVVLLFGGGSSERLVSVASAQNICAQLPEAHLWFIAKDGVVYDVAPADLLAHQRAFENELVPKGAPAFSSLGAALDMRGQGQVFLLALHGGAGENGTVQRALEARGVAFTASGSVASALAFDKAQAKAVVGARGARVAEAQIIEPELGAQKLATLLTQLLAQQPRWVLKPVSDGSSFGLIHTCRSLKCRRRRRRWPR